MLTIESPLTCEGNNWSLTLPSNLLEPNVDVKATLNLEISMKSDIMEVISPGIEFNTTGSEATRTLTSDNLPVGGDEIIVKIKTSESGAPSAILHRNESGQLAAMVSFIPNFLSPEEDEDDLEGIGEFIFLVDRSGSMWSG